MNCWWYYFVHSRMISWCFSLRPGLRFVKRRVMRAQVYGKAYKGCISSLVSVLTYRWNCFVSTNSKGGSRKLSIRWNQTCIKRCFREKRTTRERKIKKLFFSSQKYIVFDILQSRIIPCCNQITRKCASIFHGSLISSCRLDVNASNKINQKQEYLRGVKSIEALND